MNANDWNILKEIDYDLAFERLKALSQTAFGDSTLVIKSKVKGLFCFQYEHKKRGIISMAGVDSSELSEYLHGYIDALTNKE